MAVILNSIDMNWLNELFFGESIAHSIFAISLVIALGVVLGRIKIKGISIGMTWILFAGIFVSHFGMRVDDTILKILKEFGLILFVYSIGLQVGPSFFSSFRKGGVKYNLLALIGILASVAVTYILHLATKVPMPAMVGIMSGAVTNTPGLGAAQQTAIDLFGADDPSIATGYAVAYPLAVVGAILTIVILKNLFKVDIAKEREELTRSESSGTNATRFTLIVTNNEINGLTISEIRDKVQRNFVITLIKRKSGEEEMAKADSKIFLGDRVKMITSSAAQPIVIEMFGELDKSGDWKEINTQFVSRKIVITNSAINGKNLAQLRLRSYGVNITKVSRSGVDFMAGANLELRVGDRVTMVGTTQSIDIVEKKLGNSIKQLDTPNLFQLFIGILLGVALGTLPIVIPGMPQPIKIGLAGGPLIVAILMSCFGPRYKIVTYTTNSASLMLREIGISIFLACVGISAGESFVPTVINGGYLWILYGLIITMIPLLIMGFVGRKFMKINYILLSGIMSGTMTSPATLAYANEMSDNDIPSVSYATVYPLTMFMRVLIAQLMILLFV